VLLPHAIKITTAPTATPVALADLKAALLVAHDLDDAFLSSLLKLATEHVQQTTNVFLMPHTVEIGFAELCGERIELPAWPLRTLTSVKYLDADGAEQTWSSTKYQTWLDHRPPLLATAYGYYWPTTRCGALRGAWVTCEVGYANAALVPESAKQAIRLIVGHNYAHKGDDRDPTGELGIPPGALRFIQHLREDAYR
jgi:uncharacterized phiE125 gp8 family phage protein